MEEIWKDIQGYESLYQISNLGRIKSVEKLDKCPNGGEFIRFERIMIQSDSNGYKRVQLCKNGKAKQKSVHRLVAIEFIDNPKNKSQVHHKDFDRANNRADNLKWSTAKENINFTLKAGRKYDLSNRHHNAKITREQALQIKELISKGMMPTPISKLLSISVNIIYSIKSGNSWKNA